MATSTTPQPDAADPPKIPPRAWTLTPCPESLERQIARHFEKEVAEEEDAGAPSEYRCSKAEIAVHLQRGEPDIDAIEIADEVAERHKRNDPPADLANDAGFHGSPSCMPMRSILHRVP